MWTYVSFCVVRTEITFRRLTALSRHHGTCQLAGYMRQVVNILCSCLEQWKGSSARIWVVIARWLRQSISSCAVFSVCSGQYQPKWSGCPCWPLFTSESGNKGHASIRTGPWSNVRSCSGLMITWTAGCVSLTWGIESDLLVCGSQLNVQAADVLYFLLSCFNPRTYRTVLVSQLLDKVLWNNLFDTESRHRVVAELVSFTFQSQFSEMPEGFHLPSPLL